MLLKKKVNVPEWLKENDLISLLLSHATTKYEYFASRARIYSEKYGADYKSFKKKIEQSNNESLNQWDDLIEWEAYETAAEEWRARSEELKTCLTS